MRDRESEDLMTDIDNERVEGVDLQELEFSHVRGLVGPILPISDYRVVAGLLCDRHGGGSASIERVLEMDSVWRHEHAPRVRISTHRDFSSSESITFHVMLEAAQELIGKGYVSGTPEWGYTDNKKLRLNKYGARKVVEVWFRGEFNVIDAVFAGAIFNTNTGQLSW